MCELTPLAYLTLPPRPESVARARLFLLEHQCSFHHAEVADTAGLLVSELVTNAVLHGAPPIRMEITCDESLALQVRVSDASHAMPCPVHAALGDDHGRGLAITEILSDEWGIDPSLGGKTVWFRLALDGGH